MCPSHWTIPLDGVMDGLIPLHRKTRTGLSSRIVIEQNIDKRFQTNVTGTASVTSKPKIGFEPKTYALQVHCSTVELFRQSREIYQFATLFNECQLRLNRFLPANSAYRP